MQHHISKPGMDQGLNGMGVQSVRGLDTRLGSLVDTRNSPGRRTKGKKPWKLRTFDKLQQLLVL